jgi:hypothetical protein
MQSHNAFLIFKNGWYEGHNSETIAGICIHFATIDSLRQTTAGHHILDSNFLNNGDIYIFVEKMACCVLKTA